MLCQIADLDGEVELAEQATLRCEALIAPQLLPSVFNKHSHQPLAL